MLLIIRFIGFAYLDATGYEFIQADAKDYFSTADSLANGRGFKSFEYNPNNGREYLGTNYYFVAEPVYAIYLLPFVALGLDQLIIIFISNYIIYALILFITGKLAELFKIGNGLYCLILAYLLLFPAIQILSYTASPDLLRILILTVFFYFLMRLLKASTTLGIKQAVLLGFLAGFLILTRITFLFIPITVFPLLLLRSKKRGITALAYICTALITLSPWVYRNYHDFGILTLDVRFNAPKESDPRVGIASTWRITDNARWWKLYKERDPAIRDEMLNGVKVTKTAYLKLYSLRTWELFKPFPTGPPYNKPAIQLIALAFFIPWITGLILFMIKRIREFNYIWLFWSAGLLSFIGLHILRNSPHSRYMLTLVPISVIFLVSYLKQVNISSQNNNKPGII